MGEDRRQLLALGCACADALYIWIESHPAAEPRHALHIAHGLLVKEVQLSELEDGSMDTLRDNLSRPLWRILDLTPTDHPLDGQLISWLSALGLASHPTVQAATHAQVGEGGLEVAPQELSLAGPGLAPDLFAEPDLGEGMPREQVSPAQLVPVEALLGMTMLAGSVMGADGEMNMEVDEAEQQEEGKVEQAAGDCEGTPHTGTVVAPAAGGGASASPAGAPTPEGMVPVAAPPAAMDDTPLASQPLVAKFASAAKDGLGVAVEASNDGPAVAAAMEEGQPAPAANGAAGAAAVENGRAHKRRRNVPTSMYTRTRTRARMAAKRESAQAGGNEGNHKTKK